MGSDTSYSGGAALSLEVGIHYTGWNGKNIFRPESIHTYGLDSCNTSIHSHTIFPPSTNNTQVFPPY